MSQLHWIKIHLVEDRSEAAIVTIKWEPWVSLIGISCSLQYEIAMPLHFVVGSEDESWLLSLMILAETVGSAGCPRGTGGVKTLGKSGVCFYEQKWNCVHLFWASLKYLLHNRLCLSSCQPIALFGIMLYLSWTLIWMRKSKFSRELSSQMLCLQCKNLLRWRIESNLGNQTYACNHRESSFRDNTGSVLPLRKIVFSAN